jgi:hypothetical protein
MKQSPSKDQLKKSVERRVKHLMVQTLRNFEEICQSLNGTRSGDIFKSTLKTAFNDVIRAQRDELNDYEIEYRPLRLTDDNILALTKTFMETVQKIEFVEGENPRMIIIANKDNWKVMSAIRSEIEAGILYIIGDQVKLEVVGLQSCVDCVLPIMDNYVINQDVRSRYTAWRLDIVNQYRS